MPTLIHTLRVSYAAKTEFLTKLSCQKRSYIYKIQEFGYYRPRPPGENQ